MNLACSVSWSKLWIICVCVCMYVCACAQCVCACACVCAQCVCVYAQCVCVCVCVCVCFRQDAFDVIGFFHNGKDGGLELGFHEHGRRCGKNHYGCISNCIPP